MIPDEIPAGAADALSRVTMLALRFPEFRAAWESGVRDAADQVAGWAAGARLAGRDDPAAGWVALVPVPLDGIARGDVLAAFLLAVDGEVRRRAMAAEGG